ncbi:DUF1648 domain-containing protein [Microbacterium sp. 2FI]|uniref:DUF1648 domain-containing protein n=1 Tax=Microbacterium sp. 2FI TaxID=2502193 RepID=UPI0010F9D23B|nr:DUF1648 domain-containing protein [Microbacterium sp. 2FI]
MTDDRDRTHARAIRRFVLVALVVPAVLVGVGVAIQLFLLPQMPDTIAIHWNAAGEADGFAPAWTQPIATLGFGFGIAALIASVTLPTMRRGGRGATYRLMGATAAATSALVTVVLTWTYAAQAGSAEASGAAPAGVVLAAGLAAAIVIGIAAWLVQPAEERRRGDRSPATPLSLGATERAVWMHTATMSRGAMTLLAGSVLLMFGLGIGLMLGGEQTAAWITLGLGALLALLVASNTAFRVTVDESGLRVRSSVGVPRFAVPIAEIIRADAVRVDPMGEFGGWGMRWSPEGRFGVVLRAGEALEVERANGKTFVVTVDDAGTAASLLATFASRTRPMAP